MNLLIQIITYQGSFVSTLYEGANSRNFHVRQEAVVRNPPIFPTITGGTSEQKYSQSHMLDGN